MIFTEEDKRNYDKATIHVISVVKMDLLKVTKRRTKSETTATWQTDLEEQHTRSVTVTTEYRSLYQWYFIIFRVTVWWNDDVRRLTKPPKLTAIIQSRRLTLFGHIMRMDENADANRIMLASPAADWRRQSGRPRITWLRTVQQYLKQHHLRLPKAAYLAQNRPLWRMMSTYGATQS